MQARSTALLAPLALALSSCALPLSGLGPDGGGGPRDASGMDAAAGDGGRIDAGGRDAAARDGGRFDGGDRDSGSCPVGFVDVDGDPTNGCECMLAADPREFCNGRDDDCDPSTVDGSGEPAFGLACDGADIDQCRDGHYICDGTVPLRCDDPMIDTPELCTSPGDEDCDGLVDEGGAVDGITFYMDGDMDGHGSTPVRACTLPAGAANTGGDCDDMNPAVHPGATETCNGRDEDCSGLADDHGGCAPCTVVHVGTDPFMVCTTNPQGWSGARSYCASYGYRLATFASASEEGSVAALANAVASSGYWIGLYQPGGSGAWTWTDGSTMSWSRWASGEPNDGNSVTIDEDCVEMFSASGEWNDGDCNDSKRFICDRP
ncbi:MAG: lectin-like protein [Sandaracinaceae bacterium]